MKKENRGGYREGSGRPATGIQTITKNFRIPSDDLSDLEALGIKNVSRFYVDAGRKEINRLFKSKK